ncbi:MAG: hypothetical protein LBP39_03455 [Rickettsiales bacterium]|jgi:hypothetical protein|nr:hypothetical protein [Rickettsiales bacterium]
MSDTAISNIREKYNAALLKPMEEACPILKEVAVDCIKEFNTILAIRGDNFVENSHRLDNVIKLNDDALDDLIRIDKLFNMFSRVLKFVVFTEEKQKEFLENFAKNNQNMKEAARIFKKRLEFNRRSEMEMKKRENKNIFVKNVLEEIASILDKTNFDAPTIDKMARLMAKNELFRRCYNFDSNLEAFFILRNLIENKKNNGWTRENLDKFFGIVDADRNIYYSYNHDFNTPEGRKCFADRKEKGISSIQPSVSLISLPINSIYEEIIMNCEVDDYRKFCFLPKEQLREVYSANSKEEARERLLGYIGLNKDNYKDFKATVAGANIPSSSSSSSSSSNSEAEKMKKIFIDKNFIIVPISTNDHFANLVIDLSADNFEEFNEKPFLLFDFSQAYRVAPKKDIINENYGDYGKKYDHDEERPGTHKPTEDSQIRYYDRTGKKYTEIESIEYTVGALTENCELVTPDIQKGGICSLLQLVSAVAISRYDNIFELKLALRNNGSKLNNENELNDENGLNNRSEPNIFMKEMLKECCNVIEASPRLRFIYAAYLGKNSPGELDEEDIENNMFFDEELAETYWRNQKELKERGELPEYYEPKGWEQNYKWNTPGEKQKLKDGKNYVTTKMGNMTRFGHGLFAARIKKADKYGDEKYTDRFIKTRKEIKEEKNKKSQGFGID